MYNIRSFIILRVNSGLLYLSYFTSFTVQKKIILSKFQISEEVLFDFYNFLTNNSNQTFNLFINTYEDVGTMMRYLLSCQMSITIEIGLFFNLTVLFRLF